MSGGLVYKRTSDNKDTLGKVKPNDIEPFRINVELQSNGQTLYALDDAVIPLERLNDLKLIVNGVDYYPPDAFQIITSSQGVHHIFWKSLFELTINDIIKLEF